MMATNKAHNTVKTGEVIKEITQAQGKDRGMMDITGKILFGIVLVGQVEEEVEVEVEVPWTNNPNTGGQSSNQNSQ